MIHKFILKVVEDNPKSPAGFIRQEHQIKTVGQPIPVNSESDIPGSTEYRDAQLIAISRFHDAGTKVKKTSMVSEVKNGKESTPKMYISCEGIDYEVIKHD